MQMCHEKYASDTMKPEKLNKHIKQVYKDLYTTLRTNMLTQATRSKRKPATTVKYEENLLFNDDYLASMTRAAKKSTNSSASSSTTSSSGNQVKPAANNNNSNLAAFNPMMKTNKTGQNGGTQPPTSGFEKKTSKQAMQHSPNSNDAMPWSQKLAKTFNANMAENMSKLFSPSMVGQPGANPLLSMTPAAASLAAVAAAAASGNNNPAANFNPLAFFDAEFLRMAANNPNPFRMPDFSAANPYLSGLSNLFRPPNSTGGAPQLPPFPAPGSPSPFLPQAPLPPLLSSLAGQNSANFPNNNNNNSSSTTTHPLPSSSSSNSSSSQNSSHKSSHQHHGSHSLHNILGNNSNETGDHKPHLNHHSKDMYHHNNNNNNNSTKTSNSNQRASASPSSAHGSSSLCRTSSKDQLNGSLSSKLVNGQSPVVSSALSSSVAQRLKQSNIFSQLT